MHKRGAELEKFKVNKLSKTNLLGATDLASSIQISRI